MAAVKADIISQLKKDILALQGFKTPVNSEELNIGLGPIKYAFPNATFPTGVIHEFIHENAEDISATVGFIAGIISVLMRKKGISLWIGSSNTIFPPALTSFGIAPENIIFITLNNKRNILWAIEEALKCEGLSTVIGEISDLSFRESRRLQLAVEKSCVTGFILRHEHNLNVTTCVTRWKISHLPSMVINSMPGVGFPRWNVELIKVRNGKPGKWKVEWVEEHFEHIAAITPLLSEQHKKTG